VHFVGWLFWIVKLSHYRPGQTSSAPGVWGSQNFLTVCTWRWWGCQPHTPADLIPQEISFVLISVRGGVDPRAIVCLEGFSQWKIPVTPLRIKHLTFQLVVQCLNQLYHCMSWILGSCILNMASVQHVALSLVTLTVFMIKTYPYTAEPSNQQQKD
jgi:hypothetical protein